MRRTKKREVKLCRECLQSLEYNCGKQRSIQIWVNPKDEKESFCNFCKNSGFDSLFII